MGHGIVHVTSDNISCEAEWKYDRLLVKCNTYFNMTINAMTWVHIIMTRHQWQIWFRPLWLWLWLLWLWWLGQTADGNLIYTGNSLPDNSQLCLTKLYILSNVEEEAKFFAKKVSLGVVLVLTEDLTNPGLISMKALQSQSQRCGGGRGICSSKKLQEMQPMQIIMFRCSKSEETQEHVECGETKWISRRRFEGRCWSTSTCSLPKN